MHLHFSSASYNRMRRKETCLLSEAKCMLLISYIVDIQNSIQFSERFINKFMKVKTV